MKYLSTIIIVLTIAISVNAQNTFPSSGSVGIGTTAPNSHSLLEIKSTTKGVLFPRMTKAQRDAISSPPQGLLIYQTDNTKGLYYYEAGWNAVTPKSANKSLSNLTAPTAVNVELLPGADSAINLGSLSFGWKNFYLDGSIYSDGAKFISATGDIYSTFVGNEAGNVNTGILNSAFGYHALRSNTNGDDNSAYGYSSLSFNTTGLSNCAFGKVSLLDNITGSYNTAIGSSVMLYNTSGSENTAVGADALIVNNESYNVAVGNYSLANTIASQYNTAIGWEAGYVWDQGYNNVFVGANADVNGTGYYNVIAIGKGAICAQSSQCVIGNTSTISIGGYVGWTTFPSDARVKKNLKENVPGLDFINKLKPLTYNLDLDAIDKIMQPHEIKTPDGKTYQPSQQELQARKEKEQIVYTGFVAQDVEKAAKELNYDFSGVDVPKNDKGIYGLRYADFVVPLVKAVQELSSHDEGLKTEDVRQNSELENLKKENQEMKIEIANLQSSIERSSMAGGSVKSEISNPKSDLSRSSREIILGQNLPNPFNNSTLIPFRIPKDCNDASIMITNTSTSEVVSVIPISCNENHVSIDAGTLSSGIYSYTLYVDGKMVDTKSMILTK